MSVPLAPVTGIAAGVPFLAVPPATDQPGAAPVVVAWHLLDAPRTETAFAAALPLEGLAAWRIYLGLPMCGSRQPAGGFDELMRLGYEDAVLKLQGPIALQAAEEFPAALAHLRRQFNLSDGPLGLVGGSLGAAVAQLVLAESADTPVAAAVLVSPVTQLRATVDALSSGFGMTYPWGPESSRLADRLDFVARADDLADAGQPAVQLIIGEDDDQAGFQQPARDLRSALAKRYDDADRVDLVTVAGMGHALAEEPGLEPAPQTEHATVVDRHAVTWLRTHLPATN